jgi:hypothetical protein
VSQRRVRRERRVMSPTRTAYSKLVSGILRRVRLMMANMHLLLRFAEFLFQGDLCLHLR